MKLVHRGVSYEYNPPEVETTQEPIQAQARYLIAADRQRSKNRQRTMLMRSMQNIGLA